MNTTLRFIDRRPRPNYMITSNIRGEKTTVIEFQSYPELILINAETCKRDGSCVPVLLIDSEILCDMECHYSENVLEFHAKKRVHFMSRIIKVVESEHVINLDFDVQETHSEITIQVKELNFAEKLARLSISIL